jgi:hypothetical protein
MYIGWCRMDIDQISIWSPTYMSIYPLQTMLPLRFFLLGVLLGSCQTFGGRWTKKS